MSTIPIPESSAEHQDPCPTPLAWRDVLDAFRSDSTSWSVALESGLVRGRTIGRGHPLYLLNGFSGTLELYALTAWLLRERFRCVLLDYPSHIQLTAQGLGQMLLRVADHCEDEQFDVFANTFGAVPALTAALAEPHRLRRVILQGGFSNRRLSRSERMLVRGARWVPQRVQFQSIRNRIHQQNHRHWFPPYDRTRWEFFVGNALQASVQSLALRAAALRDFDVRPELSQIVSSVLLIHTEGDGAKREQDHGELERHLPQCRTENLHTCGLLPFLTHPHRLTKCISDFLLEQDSR